MFERLEDFCKRKEDLEKLISDPKVIADNKKYQEYTKDYALVSEIAGCYQKYRKTVRQIKEHKELLQEQQEPEFAELIMEELKNLEEKKNDHEKKIKLLLTKQIYMELMLM